MEWVGPFTIDQLLNNLFDSRIPLPPVSDGVYVVSRLRWTSHPTPNCEPLYVGSNTSGSRLFRTRIGSLIADIFGFYGGDKGHHSGGQSIHGYCLKREIDPKMLYLGWQEDVECQRCSEAELYFYLEPKLNKKRPAKCNIHTPKI